MAKGEVITGPFQGMKYIDQAYCSTICPKLVGTYEKEIQEVITQLLKEPFDSFIDIGSAEGYYTIGFAKFGKCKNILSFECSKDAENLQFELAKLNNVENRIKLLGHCEHQELRKVLQSSDRSLILCDIEGYEHALLDISKIPELAETTMIIECHNHVWNKMESSLIMRFEKTHKVRSFKANLNGNPNDYPFSNFYYSILPRKYKNYPILDQRAPETTWLVLNPIS